MLSKQWKLEVVTHQIMDSWETLIAAYPDPPDLKSYKKSLQTATQLLKQDLANFEIKYLLETLITEPVKLISTVSEKLNDEDWAKIVEDSLKLITKAVAAHPDHMEVYFEDIVNLCHQPIKSARTWEHALACLTAAARRSSAAAARFQSFVRALEQPRCRAAVAGLLGTICENHPQEVMQDYNTIWRTFLNLLHGNNTDKVHSALLLGIQGLLKHFGSDLPIAELNDLYRHIGERIASGRSEKVCFSILHHHSHLFPESLSSDSSLRLRLWAALQQARAEDCGLIRNCMLAVYRQVMESVKGERAKIETLTTETRPHAQSYLPSVKYTALRILAALQTLSGTAAEELAKVDPQSLEYELRKGDVPKDVVEAISFCIESNIPHSDKLLQTAILFYDTLPANRRKEIVVNGVVNAAEDVRNVTVNFLITETCQDDDSLDKYKQLWTDILKNDSENTQCVFDTLINYVIFAVTMFLEEEDSDTIPPRLSTLLSLATLALTLHPPSPLAEALAPLIIELGAPPAVARAVWTHTQDGGLVKAVNLWSCRDEVSQYEAGMLLVEAAVDVVEEFGDIISGLQIIFSSKEVEPQNLLKALNKLKIIMTEHKQQRVDKTDLCELIRLVDRLRKRLDLTDKFARELHREVCMFLGKYGNAYSTNNNIDNRMDYSKDELRGLLALNVPDLNEGSVTYKINLERILDLAVLHEDIEALETIVTIICANLPSSPHPLQQPLSLALVALSRSHPRCFHAAAARCGTVDCVERIVGIMRTERSPSSRQALAAMLGAMAAGGGAGAGSEQVLAVLGDSTVAMLKEGDSIARRAGLDLVETLLSALDNNNDLTTKFLPQILLSTLKTQEAGLEIPFEHASKLFVEKIELFNEEIDSILDEIVEMLLQNGGANKMADQSKVYKRTVKISLDFVKSVLDYKKNDSSQILKKYGSVISGNGVNIDFARSLYVLAGIKKVFDLNVEVSRELLQCHDSIVLNKLSEVQNDCNNLEYVLKFYEEFSDVLLELQYEKTRDFLAETIAKLSPDTVNRYHKSIKSCYTSYLEKWQNTPKKVLDSYEKWTQNLDIGVITHSLEKDHFPSAHALKARSLRLMLSIFRSDLAVLTAVAAEAKKWPRIIMNLYAREYVTKYLTSKVSYLTDLMTVAVKFASTADVKSLMNEGHNLPGASTDRIGIRFCRYFIAVFFDRLIERPFLLLEEEMAPCSVLVNDVVKYALRKGCSVWDGDTILDLVDELWPLYTPATTPAAKQTLLSDLTGLPRGAGRAVVLPGEDARTLTASLASLPTRVSELRSSQRGVLRSLLAALAAGRDERLATAVVALADGDPTPGWWDDAFASAAGALAAAGDSDTSLMLYRLCARAANAAACRRLLLPYIRNSSTQSRLALYTQILPELLSTLRASASLLPQRIRALLLLRTALETLPHPHLESPSSPLYAKVQPLDSSWHLVRETCKWCVTLREKIGPGGGAGDDVYREFHSANYTCLTAAVCALKPSEKIYNQLFVETTWPKMVDCDVSVDMPIVGTWSKRRVSTPSPVALTSPSLTSPRTLTLTLSRPRLFATQLSECVLQFDLHREGLEDEPPPPAILLPVSPLNRHEAAASLTALVSHVAERPFKQWRTDLARALTGRYHGNVKAFLAQAICNCKEDLKPHASAFRAALLAMVHDTAVVENGRRLVNGLHVDILQTLILWSDEAPEPSEHLNSVLSMLITTTLLNKDRDSIYNTLMDTLTKFLDVYGSVVAVEWAVFEPYVSDRSRTADRLVRVLQRVTKAKIYMPELLPTLMARMAEKQWHIATLAELFGLALGCYQGERSTLHAMISKWHAMIEAARQSNVTEYVKMVYYAQRGSGLCCDQTRFRSITNLIPKLPKTEKAKCLKIVTNYIRDNPNNQFVREVFDIIGISELIGGDCGGEALGAVRGGLVSMSEGVKKAVLAQAAEYCEHSIPEMREAAIEVMLAAFDDLTQHRTEPSPKRAKVSTSRLTAALGSEDRLTRTVVRGVALGVHGHREGLMARLASDSGVRYLESFLLSIHLPLTSERKGSVSPSAMLDLFFGPLRKRQGFADVLLRDTPLDNSTINEASLKLLSKSKTYQRTYRSDANRRRVELSDDDPSKPDIDVQVPIDSVLETLLRFCKKTPEASETLCLEVASCLQRIGSLPPAFPEWLSSSAIQATHPTPLVLKLCQLFSEDICLRDGFLAATEALSAVTIGSEAEALTYSLRKEASLRCGGEAAFELGVPGEGRLGGEVEMEFRIENLVDAFERLANWDDLRIQDKELISYSLPPLWIDLEEFKGQVMDYEGTQGWFGNMCVAYKQKDKYSVAKAVKELDKYPRKAFDLSAAIEALEWLTSDVDDLDFCVDIMPGDCLAKWAGRLMMRAAYLSSVDDEETKRKLSRSHELVWCERANEMGLYEQVLACVRRNTRATLFESETLAWAEQRVIALAAKGEDRNDTEVMRKALTIAETALSEHAEASAVDVIIGMNAVMMKLYYNLKELSIEKVEELTSNVRKYQLDDRYEITEKSKENLLRLYETALEYYDDVLEDGSAPFHRAIANMCSVLQYSIQLDAKRSECFLALILERLSQSTEILEVGTADKLFDLIQTLPPNDYVPEKLDKIKVFPSSSLQRHTRMCEEDNASLEKYARCLMLLGDAGFILSQYATELKMALKENDAVKWKETFDRMKYRILENPYAGSDYQLLTKYKNDLYTIEEYENTPAHKTKSAEILTEILKIQPSTTLRLSQLCPALGKPDKACDRLLGLPPGDSIVEFEKLEHLPTTSVRRPVVLTARCWSGVRKRWLLKGGEGLRGDAAAQWAARAAAGLGARVPGREYKVTPLTDDCGIIEFLEDHATLSSMIPASRDRSLPPNISRPVDNELILSPKPSALRMHRELCQHAPAMALRSAIAGGREFVESVAADCLLTALLGIGDRHLENILYDRRHGVVRGVDFAAILQYGRRELPPCRLTRNLVAACDDILLESRLQSLLTTLRRSRKVFLAAIRMAFGYLGEEFDEKYAYIEDFLKGTTRTCDITKDVIRKSNMEYKTKYIALLDDVFQDWETKEEYSVVDQISCLLRQSTDPYILAVTRTGWQPWI